MRELKKLSSANSFRMVNADQYGLCPNCRMLIEKSDGCDDMTCGQNAADKSQIKFKGTLAESKGCGRKFNWSQRIQLTDSQALGESKSTSAQGFIPSVTPPALVVPVAQGVPQELCQGLKMSALAILEAGNPHYVPQFAQFGPQYRITDPENRVPPFTLSSPAPNRMNHKSSIRLG